MSLCLPLALGGLCILSFDSENVDSTCNEVPMRSGLVSVKIIYSSFTEIHNFIFLTVNCTYVIGLNKFLGMSYLIGGSFKFL